MVNMTIFSSAFSFKVVKHQIVQLVLNQIRVEQAFILQYYVILNAHLKNPN